MEISKMLTVSSCHIEESTAHCLDRDCFFDLAVYNKDHFGWFIYLRLENFKEDMPKDSEDDMPKDFEENIPEDLARLINLAVENECSVLCIDCDGPVLPNYPVYNW